MNPPVFDYSVVMNGIGGQLARIAWQVVGNVLATIYPALIILGLELTVSVGLPLFEKFLDDKREAHIQKLMDDYDFDRVYESMMEYYDRPFRPVPGDFGDGPWQDIYIEDDEDAYFSAGAMDFDLYDDED